MADTPTVEYEYRDDGIKMKKGNYGVRVARPGYDAGSCSDNQLLFNSAWPIMQIAKVVDFDKSGKDYYTYSKWGDDGSLITYDEKPEKLTMPTLSDVDAEYGVSSKYCYKLLQYGTGMDSDNVFWIVEKFRVKTHQMGFVPLWFLSDWVSDISGKMILTSIDLTTDIDYPYTDSATKLVSTKSNYGIKSSSIFGSKVDGLCTNMFSKLVQRVLTTEKSGRIMKQDGVVVNKDLFWYPAKDASSLTEEEMSDLLTQYECYIYTTSTATLYTLEAVYQFQGARGAVSDGSKTYSYPIGFSSVGNADDPYDKSMVILRSPMVLPDYEEIVI